MTNINIKLGIEEVASEVAMYIASCTVVQILSHKECSFSL
jgi:uncharacterized membrane protein YebE (DUF533 family)